jgi:hypothetical protein
MRAQALADAGDQATATKLAMESRALLKTAGATEQLPAVDALLEKLRE